MENHHGHADGLIGGALRRREDHRLLGGVHRLAEDPRRLLRAMLPIAASGIMAACAPGPWVYAKPGVTYAEWKRDDAQCRELARRDTPAQRIDRNLYDHCMRQRGYMLPDNP